MRYILVFWALPMSFLWGWYFLSANDMSFGSIYLSRGFHDLVFAIYGQTLGVDPSIIPGMIAKACVLDTLIIAGIFAFRRRKDIRAWWQARDAQPVAVPVESMDNLSSAP